MLVTSALASGLRGLGKLLTAGSGLREADLAREVGRSTVGLIPYQVNDHTAGVFPMKVYEYLAAGLVDELRLVIAPTIAGSGQGLFDGLPAIRLETISGTASPSGPTAKTRVPDARVERAASSERASSATLACRSSCCARA